MSAVAEALEGARPVVLDRVESHLHPEGSFDPADHPVPTGFEEVWRFTPLKRLRDLHKDAPLDGTDYSVDVHAVAPVSVVTVAADAIGKSSSGYVPTDRVSARAWAAAPSVLQVTVPQDAIVTEPTVDDPARFVGLPMPRPGTWS